MKSHVFILSLPISVVFGFCLFVRLLAGNVFFYFSKKHDPAIFYSVDIARFESRSEIIDLDKPAGWPNYTWEASGGI